VCVFLPLCPGIDTSRAHTEQAEGPRGSPGIPPLFATSQCSRAAPGPGPSEGDDGMGGLSLGMMVEGGDSLRWWGVGVGVCACVCVCLCVFVCVGRHLHDASSGILHEALRGSGSEWLCPYDTRRGGVCSLFPRKLFQKCRVALRLVRPVTGGRAAGSCGFTECLVSAAAPPPPTPHPPPLPLRGVYHGRREAF